MSIRQFSRTQSSQNLAPQFSREEVARTIDLVPFQHPYLPIETASSVWTSCHRCSILVDRESIDPNLLWSIFAAYCARLAPESEFDLGVKIESPDPSVDIFSQQSPLRIRVEPEDSFSQFQERLETSIDLADRLYNLRNTLSTPDVELSDSTLPVVIAIAPTPSTLVDWQYSTAAMVLIAYEDGSLPQLLHTGVLTPLNCEAIVRQLQSFIPACLTQPDTLLARLPLLATAEEQQLLVDWNHTATAFPTDVCIHHLFEQQVARTPETIAIVFQSHQLTYQELNDRANQLAHYLLLQGVKPDTFVGLQMERSIDMVVGLLAIHKAGGAYLPLDPDFPADRLALMVADSQAPMILTQQRLVDSIAADVRTIAIDTSWGEIAQQPTSNPDSEVQPTNLAYIIYTSGSTGRPKGVMVEHRNAVNFFTGMDGRIDCQPGVWLAVTSLSFDISVLEIFWTLTRGFKVVVYNAKAERTQPEDSIARSIDRHQVTHLQCTPSMASMLIADPITRRAIGQIQTMMVGGEALTEALALQLRQLISGQVHNMYGPTETTIWSTTYSLSAVEGVVPLGRPIANTQLYILDRLQQPVPVGIPGELLIGGHGVTRGYLNRSELTQERFIPNPFNDDPDARLYRTGDLVRYQHDGNLEFLGRIDFQVKIRGYRIELGEIETILSRHQTIREVAIVVREDVPGDKRLVAYIIPQAGQDPTAAILRTYLHSQLPEYMVPSNFVSLSSFPLTPTHKVNRQAFPPPLLIEPKSATQIDNSDWTIEQHLIEIWQQILQVSPVDISDNFFDLGGHSLVALELFNEIERVWHKRLFLSILFKSPTISELANVIRQSDEREVPWSPLVLLESGGNKPPLFCTHPIGGNLFGYYQMSKIIGVDRPVYGLQSPVTISGQCPPDRIEDMASYFIQSIETVQAHGPYFLLGYSFGGIIAFEIARQLAERGQQVPFLGLLDIRLPQIQTIEPPPIEIVRIQIDILRKLRFTAQLEYIFKKIFHREKDPNRYRNDLMQSLAGTTTFTPELLKIVDWNSAAIKKYQPQVYPGSAHLFWSEFQNLYIDRYPDLGWGDFVAGGLEIEHIPGNHNTLMAEPNVRVLTDKIKLVMERAESALIR